jgi:hypothetical protein
MSIADYGTLLQTVAAACSAAAAFVALYVARKTYLFQKNSLLKKATIEQILKILHQLQYMKSLTTQVVLAAADEDVVRIKQRISEIRSNVKILESMISTHASADFRKIQDITDHLREEKYLRVRRECHKHRSQLSAQRRNQCFTKHLSLGVEMNTPVNLRTVDARAPDSGGDGKADYRTVRYRSFASLKVLRLPQ